jgi:hypothetical protein
MGFLPLPELLLGKAFQEWIPENHKSYGARHRYCGYSFYFFSFDQIESLKTRTLAAQAGNILPRMNNNEISTSCEPSTIHPDLPMSGNHDSDRRSMAPSVLV